MKEKKFKNYFIKYSLVFGTVGIGLILFLYVKSELNFLQLVIAMGVGEFLGGFILI